MSYYDEDEDGNGGEVLGYAIVAFIILTPVIPAGDIGLYLASLIMEGKPIVIVNILFWVGFVALYGSLLFLLSFILKLRWWLSIPLVYAQGIYLANLIKDTPYNHFSHIVANGWQIVYTFLMSQA